MSIGKSRRIVIDVHDVAMKRDLYSALAVEGRSLKDWFESAVSDYLAVRSRQQTARPRMQVAEKRGKYRVLRKGGSDG